MYVFIKTSHFQHCELLAIFRLKSKGGGGEIQIFEFLELSFSFSVKKGRRKYF